MTDFALKRRWPRVAVSVRIIGQWWNSSSDGPHPFGGLMLRLSEGGAMIQTEAKVPANSVVVVTFRLGLLQRHKLRGLVRWWRRSGEIRELGIQFDEPSAAIGRFVKDELARLKEMKRG